MSDVGEGCSDEPSRRSEVKVYGGEVIETKGAILLHRHHTHTPHIYNMCINSYECLCKQDWWCKHVNEAHNWCLFLYTYTHIHTTNTYIYIWYMSQQYYVLYICKYHVWVKGQIGAVTAWYGMLLTIVDAERERWSSWCWWLVVVVVIVKKLNMMSNKRDYTLYAMFTFYGPIIFNNHHWNIPECHPNAMKAYHGYPLRSYYNVYVHHMNV